MLKNLSFTDRRVRAATAGIIAILLLFGLVDGLAWWALGLVAVILGVTAAVGFCPLYRAIGFSSLPRRRT
ncbi:MAG: DUF2892 domain-containing protein [Bacteroidota bacterium]